MDPDQLHNSEAFTTDGQVCFFNGQLDPGSQTEHGLLWIPGQHGYPEPVVSVTSVSAPPSSCQAALSCNTTPATTTGVAPDCGTPGKLHLTVPPARVSMPSAQAMLCVRLHGWLDL
eukprot:scpid88882/ scgid11123/ 